MVVSGSLAATSKLDRGLHESFKDSKMQFVVKIDPLKLCCESWVNMGLHNFQAEIKMPLTGYIRKTSRHKLKTHKHCKCNWGKMENAAGHPSNWLVYTVTYPLVCNGNPPSSIRNAGTGNIFNGRCI